jgi:hypothetical protein
MEQIVGQLDYQEQAGLVAVVPLLGLMVLVQQEIMVDNQMEMLMVQQVQVNQTTLVAVVRQYLAILLALVLSGEALVVAHLAHLLLVQ